MFGNREKGCLSKSPRTSPAALAGAHAEFPGAINRYQAQDAYCNWFRNSFPRAGAGVGLLNPDALGRMEFFALQQSGASATKAKAG
jgi:hypothetical protein